MGGKHGDADGPLALDTVPVPTDVAAPTKARRSRKAGLAGTTAVMPVMTDGDIGAMAGDAASAKLEFEAAAVLAPKTGSADRSHAKRRSSDAPMVKAAMAKATQTKAVPVKADPPKLQPADADDLDGAEALVIVPPLPPPADIASDRHSPADSVVSVPAPEPPTPEPSTPAPSTPERLIAEPAMVEPSPREPSKTESPIPKAASKTADVATTKPIDQAATIPTTLKTQVQKETLMDMPTNLGNGLTDVMAEAQDKAKEAYEKSTVMLGDASSFARGNMEAIVESGKVFAAGLQDMSTNLVAESRGAFETMTADFKDLAAAKTPADFMRAQSEMMRKNLDGMVAYSSKTSEAMLKLVNEAMAPLSGRVSAAVEKVRTPGS